MRSPSNITFVTGPEKTYKSRSFLFIVSLTHHSECTYPPIPAQVIELEACSSDTSKMPTENGTPARGYTLPGMFKHNYANFLKNIQRNAHVVVQETTNTFLRGYMGGRNVASSHIARPGSETLTPAHPGRQVLPTNLSMLRVTVTNLLQPMALDFGSIENRQLALISPESVAAPLHCHNNLSNSEIGDLEEARQVEPGEGHGSNEAAPGRTKAIMAVLILGGLSLIVVPGLVLGIVVKEIRVGITLSGVIATVVSLLAGLHYYYHKK